MPSSTATYSLSLHDALPISGVVAEHFLDGDHLDLVALRGGRAVHVDVVHVRGLELRVLQRLLHHADGAGAALGGRGDVVCVARRSEEHTSELQSRLHLVCRLPPRPTLFPYTTLFRSRAWSPNTSLMAITSTLSPCGVDVPCTLM